MKDKLNNAMNDISDKLIEEAANATRLENKAARIARNIALPVMGAAAVAGLCIGLGKLGVFGRPQGVDLVSPAQTGAADGTTVYGPMNEYYNVPQYEFRYHIPGYGPLVSVTQEYVQSAVFDSELPRVIYADETTAAFVDGAGGVYVYDFTEEQIAFSANIKETIDIMLLGLPENFIFTNEQITSSADLKEAVYGIGLFADEDGELYISLNYFDPLTMTGKGEISSVFYHIDFSSNCIKIVDRDKISRFDGIKDISHLDCAAITADAAVIGDTDEFVFIRYSMTDYDLLPEYDLQNIELMRATEETATSEPVEGGYLPFDDFTGIAPQLERAYVSGDGFTIQFNGDGSFDIYENGIRYAADGTYTLVGDILVLEEHSLGFTWLYRVQGETLYYAEGFAEHMEANPDHPASFLNGKTFTTAEVPYTGSSWTELCDKVLEANEPRNILASGVVSYHISIKEEGSSLVGDMWVGEDYGTADTAENMFLRDDESLLDVTAFDETYYIVTSRTADDGSGGYTLKKYHVLTGSCLLGSIEVYSVSADGTEALDTTYHFSYNSNSSDIPMTEGEEEAHEEIVKEQLEQDIHAVEEKTEALNEMLEQLIQKKQATEQDIHAIEEAADDLYKVLEQLTQRQSFSEEAEQKIHTVEEETEALNEVLEQIIQKKQATEQDIHAIEELAEAMNEMLEQLIKEKSTFEEAVKIEDIISAADTADVYIMPENRVWCLDGQYTEINEQYHENGGYVGHSGIDLSAPHGAAVYAMADGEIIYADWLGGYGYCVIVGHGGGYFTVYAHCSALNVSRGDSVSAGQKIAEAGSTGYSTGNHLHLEVRRGTETIDPTEFFPEGYREICGYPLAPETE